MGVQEKRRVGLQAIRTTVKLIWAETDAYTRRKLVQSFVFLVGFSALGALTPVVYKLLIDGLSGHRAVRAYLTPLGLIAAFVLFQFLMRFCGELRNLVHGQALQRLNRRLSLRLFQHVFDLPLEYHLNRKTGAIGEILGQGLNGCHILLQHLVFTFLPVVFEFLATAVVLVNLGMRKYLLLLTVSGIAYGVVFARGARLITAPSAAVATAQIDAHSRLTDSLINYETVKFFGSERQIGQRFDSTMAHVESTFRGLLRIQTWNGLIVVTIFSASLAIALGLAGHDALRGLLTVGDFVLINTYVVRLVQPLESIGYAARDIAQGLGYLQNMLALLAELPETDGGARSANGSPVRGELAFEHVSLVYGTSRRVLTDVSFIAPPGQTLAIVGISGSGKSSLIRLLFRLYETSSGRILLDGRPIADMTLHDLRAAIAIVPQDTVLFNDTIGANICFGKNDATPEEIRGAARLARLDTLIESLPGGYDTPVGERGLKLSGGEKQRVAIARAALKQPRIFVFDEATSSLDSRTERDILQNLAEISKSCTTLVIAHRLSTVVHADKILVLNHGSLVEHGTHAALLETSGHYAQLWHAQQGSRRATQDGASSIVSARA